MTAGFSDARVVMVIRQREQSPQLGGFGQRGVELRGVVAMPHSTTILTTTRAFSDQLDP